MVTGIRLKEKVKPYAKRTAGLGHPIRLSILYLLSYGPMPLRELSEDIDRRENVVAHHVHMLISTGWVGKYRSDNMILYRLKRAMLFDLFRLFTGTPLDDEIISKKIR